MIQSRQRCEVRSVVWQNKSLDSGERQTSLEAGARREYGRGSKKVNEKENMVLPTPVIDVFEGEDTVFDIREEIILQEISVGE